MFLKKKMNEIESIDENHFETIRLMCLEFVEDPKSCRDCIVLIIDY